VPFRKSRAIRTFNQIRRRRRQFRVAPVAPPTGLVRQPGNGCCGRLAKGDEQLQTLRLVRGLFSPVRGIREYSAPKHVPKTFIEARTQFVRLKRNLGRSRILSDSGISAGANPCLIRRSRSTTSWRNG
jgi:hypothetical protein